MGGGQHIYIYIWYSVASPPMVMGQTSTPPCGCGPVVGLWWFKVGRIGLGYI